MAPRTTAKLLPKRRRAEPGLAGSSVRVAASKHTTTGSASAVLTRPSTSSSCKTKVDGGTPHFQMHLPRAFHVPYLGSAAGQQVHLLLSGKSPAEIGNN